MYVQHVGEPSFLYPTPLYTSLAPVYSTGMGFCSSISTLKFGRLAGDVYTPGQSKHSPFYDIPEEVFHKLDFADGKFNPEYVRNQRWEQRCSYKAESVSTILHAIIAADFLTMGALGQFVKLEEHVAELLAFAFLMDSRNITLPVLLLVSKHPAFNSGLIWEVCVKAAVRVHLQKNKNEYQKSDWDRFWRNHCGVEYTGPENT